jgi:hypothetical protein
MSEHRWFRETIVNDNSGETRTRVVGSTQPPTEVAPFEAREGWRLIGVEELDGPPPLSAHQRAEMQRILDRAAQRLLDEYIEGGFSGCGLSPNELDDRAVDLYEAESGSRNFGYLSVEERNAYRRRVVDER